MSKLSLSHVTATTHISSVYGQTMIGHEGLVGVHVVVSILELFLRLRRGYLSESTL